MVDKKISKDLGRLNANKALKKKGMRCMGKELA